MRDSTVEQYKPVSPPVTTSPPQTDPAVARVARAIRDTVAPAALDFTATGPDCGSGLKCPRMPPHCSRLSQRGSVGLHRRT